MGGCYAVVVIILVLVVLYGLSAIFDYFFGYGGITFKVSENMPGELALTVYSEREYNCLGYTIQHSFQTSGNEIRIYLNDTVEPLGGPCPQLVGPASFREQWNTSEGNYTLEFHSRKGIDVYGMEVTKEKITITPQKASFSKPLETVIIRKTG